MRLIRRLTTAFGCIVSLIRAESFEISQGNYLKRQLVRMIRKDGMFPFNHLLLWYFTSVAFQHTTLFSLNILLLLFCAYIGTKQQQQNSINAHNFLCGISAILNVKIVLAHGTLFASIVFLFQTFVTPRHFLWNLDHTFLFKKIIAELYLFYNRIYTKSIIIDIQYICSHELFLSSIIFQFLTHKIYCNIN